MWIQKIFFLKYSTFPLSEQEKHSARKTRCKFDVTIRYAAVKSRAHLDPVVSNGGRKYRDLKVHVSSVSFTYFFNIDEYFRPG